MSAVAAGEEFWSLTAYVSDREGRPVSDTAAVVRFEVEEISREQEGRLQADSPAGLRWLQQPCGACCLV